MTVPRVPVAERLRRCASFHGLRGRQRGLLSLTSENLAHRYYGTGAVFGKIMCIIIMVDYILLALLDYFQPRESLGRARKFNLNRWKKVSRSPASSTSHTRKAVR